MAQGIHITASCTISGSKVCKNGKTLFAANTIDLTSLLVSIYQHFGLSYNRFYRMDTLSKLGWLASEILLQDRFAKENYKPEDIGMVLTNANSSLDSDLKYMASVADIASPALFVYTLPNIMMGEISIRNNFKGESAFFVSENFDADFIQHYVTNLINTHIFRACICGWVDVLGDDYKAVLFLVEKGDGRVFFSAENMNTIFEGVND